ncbi:hypothetical protein CP061683_0889A, partial [Chlamydia psittaci 06-1683]
MEVDHSHKIKSVPLCRDT